MKIVFNISQKSRVNAVIALLTIPVFAYMFSFTIINDIGMPPKEPQCFIFSVKCEKPITLQFFYNDPPNGVVDFCEEKSIKVDITEPNKLTNLNIKLPVYSAIDKIRIDLGDIPNNRITISSISAVEDSKEKLIPTQRISRYHHKSHDLAPPVIKNNMIVYMTNGRDPYILLDHLKSDLKIVDFIPVSINLFPWLFSVVLAFAFFIFLAILSRNENVKDYSIYKLFLVVFTIIGLLMPIWGMRYSIDKDWKAEKRKLAEKKPFIRQHLFEYRDSYEKYFNDNYGYRRLLIYQYNYILYKIFNQSPLPNNVVLGYDDWMFYTAFPEVLKYPYFTDEQLITVKSNLERRNDYFKKQGIKFYITIVPEKVNVYNEYYPGFNPAKHTLHKLEQLEKYLDENSEIRIANPMELMQTYKNKYILYYKQDSHWNDLGAFMGYSSLMKQVKVDFPMVPVLSLDDYNIVEKINTKANISGMIGVDTTWKTGPHLELKNEPRSYLSSKYKHNEEEYSEILIKLNRNKNLPKILVFRDSFGEFLIPFVSESFGRSVFVFTNYIDESIVAKEKPDIVVYELSEGRINLLLKY